jgi:type VI secretion system protein ImpJ
MADELKVIWSEGMLLRPQHFQQQERYFEHLIRAGITAYDPLGWGVRSLRLDRGVLTQGKLSISAAEGIFPDGTVFRIDDHTDPRPMCDVPKETRASIVYLAVPTDHEQLADVTEDDPLFRLQRYRLSTTKVRDTWTPGLTNGTADVDVGRLHLQLLLDQDERSAFHCIPIARVAEVRADRQIVLDEDFVPACLDYRASLVLNDTVEELRGRLRAVADEVAAWTAGPSRSRVAEVRDFLLLQLINRSQLQLDHLSATVGVHPQHLYYLLIGLAGELATFAEDGRRPQELAAYRHDFLRDTFSGLRTTILHYLNRAFQPSAVSIPLQDIGWGFRLAKIENQQLLDDATFVLVVKANVRAETLVYQFPPQAKVGPPDTIDDLVNRALPGIELVPLGTAPPQIPFHDNAVYFKLNKAGAESNPHWSLVKQSTGLAIHVSGDFPNLELSLWAIMG